MKEEKLKKLQKEKIQKLKGRYGKMQTKPNIKTLMHSKNPKL